MIKWWILYLMLTTLTISKVNMGSTWMKLRILLFPYNLNLSCFFYSLIKYHPLKKGWQSKNLSGQEIWASIKSIMTSTLVVKISPEKPLKCANKRENSYKNTLKIKTLSKWEDSNSISKDPLSFNKSSQFISRVLEEFIWSRSASI